MIWRAIYKDGTIINEYECGKEFNFLQLDKEQIDKFMIIETGNEGIVNFSVDNGKFNFSNLDLRKLEQLTGGEKLTIEYDKDKQNFKMTPESLELFKKIKLEEEAVMDKIEFDQTGKFYINGQPFHLSFELNGKDFEFLNQPPYTNIIHKKQGYTEFKGKRNSDIPYRRDDGIEGYYIGYEKEYNSDPQFKLSLVLYYDVIFKVVTLQCKIWANKMIDGKVVLHFGENQHQIPVTLIPHLPPVYLERIITRL